MGGIMTFLKISQNQSIKIEQDYALQSFTLLLLLKCWLIQTAELLTWATVNIVTATNNLITMQQLSSFAATDGTTKHDFN